LYYLIFYDVLPSIQFLFGQREKWIPVGNKVDWDDGVDMAMHRSASLFHFGYV
jgi:hypothetical protein